MVGENAAEAGGAHSAGLNGLWSLGVREGDTWSDSVFTGGGLNLEHYFDRCNWRKGEGEWVDRMVYRPRHFPMTLPREGDALVLH